MSTRSRPCVPSFPRKRESRFSVIAPRPTLDARRSLPPTLIGGGHDGPSLCLKPVLSPIEGAKNFIDPRERSIGLNPTDDGEFSLHPAFDALRHDRDIAIAVIVFEHLKGVLNQCRLRTVAVENHPA